MLTSQPGEEIFLGPKISFASARQPTKNEDDTKAGTSPEKSRSRVFGRDRDPRDKETRDKPRYDKSNGNNDEVRAFAGFRKGYEKKFDEDDADSEEAELRRRAKLEKPWFRGERKNQEDNDDPLESSGERGWRERERRGDRADRGDRDWQRGGKVEQDPQWMREDPKQEDFSMHTQEDFEKWKQAMKGGPQNEDNGNQATTSNAMFDSGTLQAATASSGKSATLDDPTSVFGMWSEPKREERESSVSTPKTTSKQKSSRFTSFFGPTATEPNAQPSQQIQQSHQPQPMLAQEPRHAVRSSSPPRAEMTSPAAQRSAPGEENNEALAFQKVLQMLKVGNGPSQGSGGGGGGGISLPFTSSPTPQQTPVSATAPEQIRGPRPNSISAGQKPYVPTRSAQSIASQPIPAQHAQHAQQPQQAQQPQRPPIDNRNSEFLLKLMQQPQQTRTPFAEGQIYGQSYNQQKNPGELTALLNNLNLSHGGPPQQVSGPPPGMYKQERQPLPQQQMPPQVKQAQVGVDERMAGMHPRHMPAEEHRFPPGFQQGMHFPGGRPMQLPEQLQMPHLPPGQALPPHLMHQQGRGGPPPPGFYNQQSQVPGMRGGIPSQYYGQGLPPHLMSAQIPQGFHPQPPPGMQQHQGRRPPSMQMQPGFDIYANIEAARRDHPGQQLPPGQYPQYMK